MDYNNTNSTRNSNSFSSFQTKILSLENKITIYKKELSVLEEKLLLYENDSKIKSEKLSEHVNQIMTLEKENNYLKNLLNQIKSRNNNNNNQNLNENFNKTTSTQINNEFNIELNKLNKIIESLKTENENLNKINYEKNIQIDNLNKLLNQKNNENDAFNNDNTILLNKLKEYEENFLTMRNNSINNMNNKSTNQISENNYYDKQNNKIKEEEIIEKFNNQISELNKLIMSELKTISQYIDTYLILFNEENLLIPNLKKITNFPNNSFLNFDILINSIQNARERLFEQQNKNENIILSLKDEISLLNNKLNEKIIENSQIKNQLNNLKEKNYELELYLEKYSGEIDNQKNLTKKIQNSISNIDENNDKYLQNIYDILRDELEKILRDNELRNYASIILSSEKKSQSVDFGIKFLFEEALDKFIFINNCLIDDYKKLQSKKIQDPSIYINTINELNETISELKERIAKKENNSFFRNSSLRKYSDGKFE